MANKDSNRKDRVTIYEVARVAGVSLATVSRVLNNSNTVTESTRKIVQATIDKLGYKPSAIARGLAISQSTNIGIMIPSTGYSYVSNMLDGMIDVAKIYGYVTSIFVTNRNKEDDEKVVDSLIRSQVEGAVIYDDELGTDEISQIQRYNIPLIVIGHDMSGDDLGSIVLEFNKPVCEVLTKHLEVNPNDVNILNVINEGKLVDDVRDSIVKLTEKHNGKANLIEVHDSYGLVYDTMKEYFKDHRGGYFYTPRDSLGCAILNAALESNLRVPEDVQILSCIGSKYSYIVRPTISSFSMDMFKVGSIAVRMLTKLLNGEELSQKIFTMNANFNKRDSTL